MEREVSLILQILVEPTEHVTACFLGGFDGELVVGVVSAGEAVGHAREDLHEVVNLQKWQI